MLRSFIETLYFSSPLPWFHHCQNRIPLSRNRMVSPLTILAMLLSEMVLLIVTISVVVIGASMALLVGLVLPDYDLKLSGDEDFMDSRIVARTYLPEDIQLRRQERKPSEASSLKFIVSILATRFIDAVWSKRFLCTGTIISADLVLTGDDCIRYPLEDKVFRRSIISFGSDRWSAGTNTRYVYDFEKMNNASSVYNKIFVLKVDSPFPTDHVVIKFPSFVPDMNPTMEATFYGWGSDEDSRDNILYGDLLFSENYYTLSNSMIPLCTKNKESLNGGKLCETESIVGFDIDKRSSLNGRPLITINDDKFYLIAMEVNAVTKGRNNTYFRQFLNLRNKEFLEWIGGVMDAKTTTIDFSKKRGVIRLMSIISSQYYNVHEGIIKKHYVTRKQEDTEF